MLEGQDAVDAIEAARAIAIHEACVASGLRAVITEEFHWLIGRDDILASIGRVRDYDRRCALAVEICRDKLSEQAVQAIIDAIDPTERFL